MRNIVHGPYFVDGPAPEKTKNRKSVCARVNVKYQFTQHSNSKFKLSS